MADAKHPHPGHEKHLCYLNSLGYQLDHAEDFVALVKDGKFWCKSCGRVAAEAKNLCEPVKL